MDANKDLLIDQYLQNTISDAEALQLGEALESDKSLRETLEKRVAIKAGLQAFYRNEIKQEFAQWEQEANTKQVSNKAKVYRLNPKWRAYAAAASIAFILISLFLWLNIKPKTPDNLYAAYYHKYPNYVADITRGDNSQDEQLKLAFIAYEQNNYSQAIRYFERLKTQENAPSTVKLYLGLSYLSVERYKEGVGELESFLAQPNQDFSEAAKWYLALAYLKIDESEKSRSLLKELYQNQGDYAKKSKTLLNDL